MPIRLFAPNGEQMTMRETRHHWDSQATARLSIGWAGRIAA